jgi:hypothetical protein
MPTPIIKTNAETKLAARIEASRAQAAPRAVSASRPADATSGRNLRTSASPVPDVHCASNVHWSRLGRRT